MHEGQAEKSKNRVQSAALSQASVTKDGAGREPEEQTKSFMSDNTKRALKRKGSRLIAILLAVVLMPGLSVAQKFGACGLFVGHAILDWLLSLHDEVAGQELEVLARDTKATLALVRGKMGALVGDIDEALNESVRRHEAVSGEITRAIQQSRRLAENTASALRVLYETRHFDPVHDVHMAVLKRIRDKFLECSCPSTYYADTLKVGIRASSNSWLGIHTRTLTFFTDPTPETEGYLKALAENSSKPEMRQLRLVVRTKDNDTEFSNSEVVKQYGKVSVGVKSYWISEAAFKSEYRALANGIDDDWALFDECLALQYDKEGQRMTVVLNGDQFDAMRRLYRDMRRCGEHGQESATFHLI